jgi:hypothetical protein
MEPPPAGDSGGRFRRLRGRGLSAGSRPSPSHRRLAGRNWAGPLNHAVLPANLPVRVVRMARMNDMIARLFCTDAITGQEVMWPDELEVWVMCGGRCHAWCIARIYQSRGQGIITCGSAIGELQ